MTSRCLSDEDFIHFRRTCHAIKSMTDPLFIERYFHTRYVMMERRSLKNLVSISQHPIFGPSVRALEVCVDHLTELDEIYEALKEETRAYWLHALSNRGLLNEYNEYIKIQADDDADSDNNTRDNGSEDGDNDDGDGDGSDGSDSSSDGNNNYVDNSNAFFTNYFNINGIGNIYGPISDDAFNRCLQDQGTLLESGLAASFLSSAMANLPNCKTITINDSEDVRPWGAYLMASEIGVLPCRSIAPYRLHDDDFIQSLIHAVFMALFTSCMRLDELSITFGFLKPTSSCVGPQLLKMPPCLRVPPQVQFTTLKYLRLSLDPKSAAPGRRSWEELRDDDSEDWGATVVKFINMFPALSNLELHFFPQDNNQFPYLCSNLKIPKLQRLELFGIECAATDLARILTPHKQTIHEIFLENIKLNSKGGNWSWLLSGIRDNFKINSFSMSSCMSQNKMLKSEEDNDSHRFYAENQQEFTAIITEISRNLS